MAARKAGQGSKWIRLSTRLAIYFRDGFTCAYCGRSADTHGVQLTLDHIVACELGGDNSPSNLITCCVHCNSSKQHKTMTEWWAVLKVQGRNVRSVSARIARLRRKPLDRAEGRRLAQVRNAARPAKAA
jgi:hypothetical protein